MQIKCLVQEHNILEWLIIEPETSNGRINTLPPYQCTLAANRVGQVMAVLRTSVLLIKVISFD